MCVFLLAFTIGYPVLLCLFCSPRKHGDWPTRVVDLPRTAENAEALLGVCYDFLKLFIPRGKVSRKDFVVCCNSTTIEFILLCAVVAICRSLIV